MQCVFCPEGLVKTLSNVFFFSPLFLLRLVGRTVMSVMTLSFLFEPVYLE